MPQRRNGPRSATQQEIALCQALHVEVPDLSGEVTGLMRVPPAAS
jgi:hypothetical protein